MKLLHTIGAGIASDIAEFTLEKGEELLKESLNEDDFKTLDRIVDIDESQVHSSVHDFLKNKALPF